MASFGTAGTSNTSLALPPDHVIFGRSAAMEIIRGKIEKMASTNLPVLLEGESGTGKEMIARYIHARSARSEGAFAKVNCPAIPGSLLESELFGYESGAFTGANESKPGRVELAAEGTLFLDEIAEMDAALQAKLLQLLQDGQFARIGAREDTRVNLRVICATNRDLQKEIAAGTFRQDLYFRINVLSLHLPPLRERRGDLPVLLDYFFEYYQEKFSCQPKPMSGYLMRTLEEYHWPGNIRELENLVKRYLVLGNEEAVAGELVRGNGAPGPELPQTGPISLKKLTRQAVHELERQIILRSLQANNWNRKRVARALSISYRALLYKIRDAGLGPVRAKPVGAPEPTTVPGSKAA